MTIAGGTSPPGFGARLTATVLSPYTGFVGLLGLLLYVNFEHFNVAVVVPAAALIAGWSSRWSP